MPIFITRTQRTVEISQLCDLKAKYNHVTLFCFVEFIINQIN
jgi:hypothetical protein